MIQHPSFRIEPWSLHETALNRDVLAQTESLFALSNGHIGLRGNLDEGEPHGLPGSYLNGFYELRPLPSAETQYGAPESSQTMINVINGKLIRLLIDDEPFDIRYGHLIEHDRVLDFRAGTLTRRAEWCSPAHRTVRITSTRLVSFTRRSIVAIAYEVEPIDGAMNVVVQSELVANEALPAVAGDPRTAAILEAPLVSEEHAASGTEGLLVHSTRLSNLRVAAAMNHIVDGTPGLGVVCQSAPDSARVVMADVLEPGQRLRLIKLVAYGWSHERTRPAMRDQVAAAVHAA
jgi:alpha,alpha-trehalose phosphorylase